MSSAKAFKSFTPLSGRVPAKKEKLFKINAAHLSFIFVVVEKGSRTCVDLAMRPRPKWRNRKQELGRGRRWRWRGQQTQLELPASQTFSFNETNKSLWGSFVPPILPFPLPYPSLQYSSLCLTLSCSVFWRNQKFLQIAFVMAATLKSFMSSILKYITGKNRTENRMWMWMENGTKWNGNEIESARTCLRS